MLVYVYRCNVDTIVFTVHICFCIQYVVGTLALSVATEMCVGPNRSKIMGIGTAAFWGTSLCFFSVTR